ncbi:MAG TPA: hypothetical protein DCW44_05575 [Eubacterium sp.]|nr:hypothetical protein [Eubacterium sp.]
MKLLKRLTLTSLATVLMMASSVFADSSIKDVKITGKTTEGGTVDVYLTEEYKADSKEIKAVAPENVKELVIEPELNDENATYTTDWTKMDPGENTSRIFVKSSVGTIKYTVYTTLSDDKYNEYVQQHDEADSTLEVIGKKGAKYYVKKSLKDIELPYGFKRKKIKYHDTKVVAAFSEAKNMTLLYLLNESGEGEFFVYNETKDSFSKLKEIKVKSRLYTIAHPETRDKGLKKYDREYIKIGGNRVKVWVKNEEEGLYLLYLMNWDGEIGLYQFDSKENVFQRFIINESAEATLDTADKTIAEQDKKYNAFVKKYNKENSFKWKIIIGLIVLIVVLGFVILNLGLKIASFRRKLKDAEDKAIRATSKRSKYYVEKPGIKTVVPNQKVEKKPKEDVDMKSVTPIGYDDLSIDMTDDVKKEFEEKPKSEDKKPSTSNWENRTRASRPSVEPRREIPVRSEGKAETAAKSSPVDDDDDDDGFEFIMIDD